MAIALRGTTTPSTTGGTADPIAAVALPGSTEIGDMVGAFFMFKYDSVVINQHPAQWQNPANNQTSGGAGTAGNDSGVLRIVAYFREYNGVWSMPTLDLDLAPNVSMAGALSWSKASTEMWAPVACANSSDTTGSTTSYDPAASATTLDLGSGDWLGCWTGINGDAGTPGAITLTVSGVTFGAKVDRFGATGVATGTGQDARCFCYDVPYSSGTASAGPDTSIAYTSANANMGGASIFFRLRVFNPGTPPSLVVPRGQIVPSGRIR